MKALLLGCGEMGKVAVQDLLSHGVFSEVAVATRTPAVAEQFLGDLPDEHTRTSVHPIDVHDRDALIRQMRGFDVTCNMTGPNYLNAVPVAKAAIAAGVNRDSL